MVLHGDHARIRRIVRHHVTSYSLPQLGLKYSPRCRHPAAGVVDDIWRVQPRRSVWLASTLIFILNLLTRY